MSDKDEGLKRTNASPPRWNTKEFYFYYAVFIIVVPWMIKVGCDLSSPNHHNYFDYQYLLSKGWIPGRQVDNSDAQYAQFRNNIPKLIPLAFTHVLLNRLARNISSSTKVRIYFSLFLSLAVLIGLHGSSSIKILMICSASFAIGRLTGGSKLNPLLTWLFNISILFLNEWKNGYKFEDVDSGLAWLDGYSGLLRRWHILFNFVILRLISFNMDYYWQCQRPRETFEKKEDWRSDESLSDKDRINMPCKSEDYNYVAFLTYTLYTPLYLCGPILTFNDFISQIYRSSSHLTKRYTVLYAIRLAFVILVMEIMLHFIYVVAISKAEAWTDDSPFELSMIGYFNLLIIWMKLLIPWRFFRLWALFDGIWTEENMIRCMSNNFSAQRFWKSWHRTFNRWMIRYIFIPLGGSKYMKYNMWVIFTFVALWHDIELKLLVWAWLICLFLLPELIATRVFSYEKFGHKPYYRAVCGVGAVCNIFMMMIANLVGFCVGFNGMVDLATNIFYTADGLVFLALASVSLYTAAQVMFEIRESEKRRGDIKWKM